MTRQYRYGFVPNNDLPLDEQLQAADQLVAGARDEYTRCLKLRNAIRAKVRRRDRKAAAV